MQITLKMGEFKNYWAFSDNSEMSLILEYLMQTKTEFNIHFVLKFQSIFSLPLKTQMFYSPNPKSINWFSKASKSHLQQDFLL